MGYSVSWLAVKSAVASELLTYLGLEPSGKWTQNTDVPLAGSPIDPWYLVIANRCGHRIVSPPVLQELSKKHELVACSVEEHVMVSSAAYWREGICHWAIEHDSSRGIRDVQLVGQPPPSFGAYQSKRFAELERASGDSLTADFVFELPLDLAEELTGFRHDAPLETTEVLQDRSKRSWWQFWA